MIGQERLDRLSSKEVAIGVTQIDEGLNAIKLS